MFIFTKFRVCTTQSLDLYDKIHSQDQLKYFCNSKNGHGDGFSNTATKSAVNVINIMGYRNINDRNHGWC